MCLEPLAPICHATTEKSYSRYYRRFSSSLSLSFSFFFSSSVSLGKIVRCVRGHLFLSSRAYRAPSREHRAILLFVPYPLAQRADFIFFSPLFFLLFPGSIGFRRSCSRIGFYLRVSPREEWKNTWRTTFWERKRSREKERERGKEKNSPSFGPRGSRS